MSSPIDLPLQRNYAVAVLTALPWLVPLLLAWLLPAPLFLRLLLIPLIIMLAWRSASMTGLLQHPAAPVRLLLHQQQVCVILRNGTTRPVRVGSASRISGGTLWLALADDRHCYRLFLSTSGLLANTDAAGLRRLTVRLRLSPETEHPVQQATGEQHGT